VTFQDIAPEHSGYFASELTQWKSGNAIKARHSFSEFRQTIRPDMKWNWMTDIVTNELQGFCNAFAAGKRPKLAIEMPPQHGSPTTSWHALLRTVPCWYFAQDGTSTIYWAGTV
jgi:hypothetical protein